MISNFDAGRSSDPNSLISCLEDGAIPSPATNISVAQLAEQRSPKPKVGGSIPPWDAKQGIILWQIYS